MPYPKLGWLKLIGGEKKAIDFVNVGLPCKTYFVLGILRTFIQYQNPKLNKNPNPRGDQLLISSLRACLVKGGSEEGREEVVIVPFGT